MSYFNCKVTVDGILFTVFQYVSRRCVAGLAKHMRPHGCGWCVAAVAVWRAAASRCLPPVAARTVAHARTW